MQRDIRSEREGLLEERRGEGVIHHRERPSLPRDAGDGADVAQPQERIGGSLQPYHPCFRPHCPGDPRDVSRIHVAHGDAEAREDLVEQSPRTAVEVIEGDDVVPLVEKREREGRLGREPGREGEGVLCPLERRELPFQGVARWIPGARVLVASSRLCYVFAREGRWE